MKKIYYSKGLKGLSQLEYIQVNITAFIVVTYNKIACTLIIFCFNNLQNYGLLLLNMEIKIEY